MRILVSILLVFHVKKSIQNQLPKMSMITKTMKDLTRTFESLTEKLEQNSPGNEYDFAEKLNDIDASMELDRNKAGQRILNIGNAASNVQSKVQNKLNEIIDHADAMMGNFRFLTDLLLGKYQERKGSTNPTPFDEEETEDVVDESFVREMPSDEQDDILEDVQEENEAENEEKLGDGEENTVPAEEDDQEIKGNDYQLNNDASLDLLKRVPKWGPGSGPNYLSIN